MLKRVLVTGAANIGKAGVATIVYKWGQQFDSDKIVYDYLMQSGLPDKKYQDAIKAKGGILYTIGKPMPMIGIIKWVENIIRDNGYKKIHINTDTAYIAAAYIFASKKAGIEHIFVHSHCTQIDDISATKRIIKTIMHKICTPYVIANSEKYLACSKLAGEWMFGKSNVASQKYKLIYNGVEVEKYLYKKATRDMYRKNLNFDEKFVIANIGRLSFQKNQEFLLDVFRQIYDTDKNTLLVLVGSGELENVLKQKANELCLSESIIFLGTRDDIPSLLSAFDVLVMPSRFEGLPVTMVEAQMSDLPCVVASTITKEAKFTTPVEYVEGWDELIWKETILRARDLPRNCIREEKLCNSFNITKAAKSLEKILMCD